MKFDPHYWWRWLPSSCTSRTTCNFHKKTPACRWSTNKGPLIVHFLRYPMVPPHICSTSSLRSGYPWVSPWEHIWGNSICPPWGHRHKPMRCGSHPGQLGMFWSLGASDCLGSWRSRYRHFVSAYLIYLSNAVSFSFKWSIYDYGQLCDLLRITNCQWSSPRAPHLMPLPALGYQRRCFNRSLALNVVAPQWCSSIPPPYPTMVCLHNKNVHTPTMFTLLWSVMHSLCKKTDTLW